MSNDPKIMTVDAELARDRVFYAFGIAYSRGADFLVIPLKRTLEEYRADGVSISVQLAPTGSDVTIYGRPVSDFTDGLVDPEHAEAETL
jgi:hypothetical protein